MKTKMRKILCVLMVCLLVMAPVPAAVTTVSAAGHPVCEIGGTQYETLGAALNAVGAGETKTIRLLEDIDYDGGIEIENKSIIFDLDGHTLEVVNTSDGVDGLWVMNGAVDYIDETGLGEFNVTAEGGGVSAATGGSATVTNAVSSGSIGAYAYEGGSIVVKGDARGYYGAVADGGGSVVVKGDAEGTVFSARAYEGGSIVVEGDARGIERGVCAEGAGSSINVGGSVEGGYYGAFADDDGSVVVEGNAVGTGDGSYSARAHEGGSVVVEGDARGIERGVYAYGAGSSINVGGDAEGGSEGAYAYGGGEITIEGEILSAAVYITVGSTDKGIDNYEAVTTKPGYRTYTDGTSTVWVRDVSADTTPPAVETYSPADDATDAAIDTNLVLTFSEDVTSVAGYVYLYRAADNTSVAMAVYGPAVSVSGRTVTIDPGELEYSTGYYVTIDPGAFEDLAGNAYAGISGSDTWNFTTVGDGGPPADTSPPTVPDNLRVIDRTTSSITIAWNASTDASGIAGYDIQMKRGSNGAYSVIGSTDETSFTATGLQSSATYYFQVRAKDASDNANLSAWSAGISATTMSSGGGGGGGSAPVNSASEFIWSDKGGSVRFGDATVEVPAGTLPANATLKVTQMSATEANKVVPEGLQVKLGSDVYEITTSGDREFGDKTLTIRIAYDQAKIAAGEQAVIRYRDETTGQWINLPTTVEQGADGKWYAVTHINHLTKFAVFSAAVKAEEPAPSSVKVIKLTLGNTAATVDGSPYTLDAAPRVDTKADRTLVPVRFVSEALGAKVEWIAETRQIVIKDGGKEIILTLGSKNVLVNGQTTAIDCAPTTLPPGRTFVPLRFVSETLGATVGYGPSNRQITITK
ncbi:MAG: stalk domain-containing protein [Bacillota bacterium]